MTQEAFDERHATIKENLKKLLTEHPDAKDDYRKLVQYFWYYIDGLANFIPLEYLLKLTNPESIDRAFRKLKEEDPTFRSTKKIEEARAREEDYYRTHYGKRLPDYQGDD